MIKNIILLLGILFVYAGNIQSQVVVQIKQPPPGKLNVENLWSVTLKNTTQITYKVYLEGNLTEATDGLIFNATSSEFNLPPGTTTVTVSDVSPISSTFPVAKYKNILMQTGEVPSGQYQVCVQVRQKAGVDLGFQCINQTVTQISAITLLAPAKDSEVLEKNPTFNWIPILGQSYQYNFVVAEKIGTPQQSIKVPIFSKTQAQSVLVYPVSAPLLEAGKTYVWQVTLLDQAGNVVQSASSEIWSFKKPSSGISGEDGYIKLVRPADNGELETSKGPSGGDVFRFTWKKANTKKAITEYRVYVYKAEFDGRLGAIVSEGKINGGSNKPEYSYDIYVEKGLLNKGDLYAWKVEAYSESYKNQNNGIVGKSDVNKFKVTGGVTLADNVEKFTIGKYTVEVLSITNSNPSNFSGKGKVMLWEGGPKIFVDFSKLVVEGNHSNWKVKSGEIQNSIALDPGKDGYALTNQETKSFFMPQVIKMTPEKTMIQGSILTRFPFVSYTQQGMYFNILNTEIESATIWLDIDPIKKLTGGPYYCKQDYNYSLGEPAGFKLAFTKTTNFTLQANKLTLSLYGDITLPENIKSVNGSVVKIMIANRSTLKFTADLSMAALNFPLNKKKDVNLHLISVLVDLAPKQGWKGGLRINSATVYFPQNSGFDKVTLNEQNTSGNLFLTSKGITAKTEISGLNYNSKFYGFDCKVDKFVIDYKDNALKNCSFTGGLYIPLIGINVNYVIPVTDNGIGKGDLDYGDLGSVYLFGNQPNEKDRLNFRIYTATITNDKIVFQGELMLDNKNQENLKTGNIYVSNLYVTSAGDIGFEGSPWKQLNNYTDSDYNGYDATLTQIRIRKVTTGYYAFDVKGTIIVSEDLSAPGGSAFLLSYKFYKNSNQGGSGSELSYSNQVDQGEINVTFQNGQSTFNAGLTYWNNDATYGKGFRAIFTMNMQSPSSYSFSSKIVTGIAPAGFKYWFVEAATEFPTPIAIGIGDLGIKGFKGRVYSKMSHSGTGIAASDYHPDANNTFGVFAEVPFLSTSDNGYKIWGKTSFEVMIGNGFKSVLMGDAYLLSSGYGSTDGKVHGNVTVTVSTSPKYFSCDAFVNANIDNAICGTGTMALYFGEDTWYVNLGTKQSPVTINMYCGTSTATSYFGLNPSNIAFGIGYSIDTGPRKWAVFYGRAWGSITIDGALNYSPFQFTGSGVLKGGGELGFYYDVFCCSGYLPVLSAEVTAALNVQLPSPVCFAGKISARGCIWKLCKTVTLKMKYKNGSFSMEETC